MKTPACKNEFTSECRLQTRLTIYKCKNASIFFILLTTCFLSRQKPCKGSSSASFSYIAPPFNVFVIMHKATASPDVIGVVIFSPRPRLQLCLAVMNIAHLVVSLLSRTHRCVSGTHVAAYSYLYSGRSISLGILYIPPYDLLFLSNIPRCALL